jgi:hypothetical protein
LSIEKKIEDLIDAIEKNTAALLGAKPAASTAPAAVAATKTASSKPKGAPAKTEEQLVAEATKTESPSLTVDDVKKAVDKLLKANKRQDAIDLMADFEGAKNATEVAKLGEEAIESFVKQANDLLAA